MTIELKNLTKTYGDLIAVNAIDLDVGDGEVLCLLGPSGCGKTTTLRMVAGLETATDEIVRLDGRRVNELGPRERNVAMSFQFYALYPSLSVAQNLAFPLHADNLSKAEIARRMSKIADTPHSVFQHPANLFVAGFIGTPQMNLLPATLTGTDGGGMADFAIEGGQRMKIVVDPRISELSPGSRVTLGVRPRNIEISHEPVEGGLSTRIDILEPMGAETLAHLHDGLHDLRLVTDWRVPLRENDQVHTRFLPGTTHIFTDDGQVLRSQ